MACHFRALSLNIREFLHCNLHKFFENVLSYDLLLVGSCVFKGKADNKMQHFFSAASTYLKYKEMEDL